MTRTTKIIRTKAARAEEIGDKEWLTIGAFAGWLGIKPRTAAEYLRRARERRARDPEWPGLFPEPDDQIELAGRPDGLSTNVWLGSTVKAYQKARVPQGHRHDVVLRPEPGGLGG
jgi:hypothetical protein